MNTDLNQMTEKIIGCSYKVGNELGCGFLEKVYENALIHELRNFADIVVEGRVIIELKAQKRLEEVHAAQCINYLAATRLPVCLLINFWTKVEVKRFVGRSYSES